MLGGLSTGGRVTGTSTPSFTILIRVSSPSGDALPVTKAGSSDETVTCWNFKMPLRGLKYCSRKASHSCHVQLNITALFGSAG